MTLQQLRYLCAIDDCGFNISRAADLLHSSQLGISKQIGMLEEELDTGVSCGARGHIFTQPTASRPRATAQDLLQAPGRCRLEHSPCSCPAAARPPARAQGALERPPANDTER